MANTTLNIFEVAALCDTNGLVLESRRLKNDKGTFDERWFLNRVGARGPLNIAVGDCTREGEEPPYEKPFLGKKPERHVDAAPDATTRGALTIIPNKAEGDAWIKFNRWVKSEILRVGAIRDKKNNVVASMEKLESEFKDIVIEPDPTNELRKNVCFWQKLQVGGRIPDLNTKFQYLRCVRDTDGKKRIELGSSFDVEVLKAGSPAYSVIQISELKKAPSGWQFSMYTRNFFTDDPVETSPGEPTIVFGGIEIGKPASVPDAPAQAFSPSSAPITTQASSASDISDLAKNLAKFSKEPENKRQKV